MGNSYAAKPRRGRPFPCRRADEEGHGGGRQRGGGDRFLSFLGDRLSDAGTPRNGRCERKVPTAVGEIAALVPRGRLGPFGERAIGRHGRRADGLDWETGRLCSQGMSASGISQCLSAKPCVEVSERLVLAIAKGSHGEPERFNSRALPRRPFVCLDGTWLPVRSRYEGGDRHEKECVMVALGVAKTGNKEVLGFWMEPSESSAEWEKCLRNLKERGIGNPLMFVTDGLQGMKEAIKRVFPDSLHQRCPVHVGRNMSSGARKGPAGDIGRLQGSAFGRIGSRSQGSVGPVRGQAGRDAPAVQGTPLRAGAVPLLRVPKADREGFARIQRGGGLPRLLEEEAQAQAGDAFDQERLLPHIRRGREARPIQALQGDSGLRRAIRRRAEAGWHVEAEGVKRCGEAEGASSWRYT